jgi:hypothetical protein
MDSRSRSYSLSFDEINPFSIDFPPAQLSSENVIVIPIAPPILRISDLFKPYPTQPQTNRDFAKRIREESTSDSEEEPTETDAKKIKYIKTESPTSESKLLESQQLFFSMAQRNKRLIDLANKLNRQLELKEQEITFWKDLSKALPEKTSIELTSVKKDEDANEKQVEAKEEVLEASYITVQHITDTFFHYTAIQRRPLEEADLPTPSQLSRS